MVTLNKHPHLRIASNVALILEEDFEIVHLIAKRFFYKKVLPNVSLAGRLKHFHEKPVTCNRGPRYISLNKRHQNTLFDSSCSRLCDEISRSEPSTEGTSASRDRDNAEERSNISEKSYTQSCVKYFEILDFQVISMKKCKFKLLSSLSPTPHPQLQC